MSVRWWGVPSPSISFTSWSTSGGEDDIVAAVDELWRRGILVERGHHAYDFSHDRIREVAYRNLGPARRRSVHGHLARALRDRHGDGANEVVGEIAVHYDRAGSVVEAATYHQRAVDAAQRVYGYDDVLAFSARGLELVAELPPGPDRDDRELAFLVPRGVALYGRGRQRSEHRWIYDRIMELRAQRGLPPEPVAIRTAANLAIGLRDFVDARARGEQLLALGAERDDPLLLTEGHYMVGVSSFWLAEFERSHRHLAQALAHYDDSRTRQHLEQFGQDPKAVCLLRLAWASWHLGRLDDVESSTSEALSRARQLDHDYTDAYVRTFGAWFAVDRGRAGEAAELVDGLDRGDWGTTWISASAKTFLAWAESEHGDPMDGTRRLEEAVEATRASGQGCFEPIGLMLLARSHARTAQPAAALIRAGEALEIGRREMPFNEVEAQTLYGELLGQTGGDPDEVVSALRAAVATASARDSVVQELRARAALRRWYRRAGGSGWLDSDRRLDELLVEFPTIAAAVDRPPVGGGA